jgi:hypothetical protein
MKRNSCQKSSTRVLRRAATFGLVSSLAVVLLPAVAGATAPVDSAPTITAVTATGGDVTVTWTNSAPDATSIDVILYDVNGNVIDDDNVGPTLTTDTFNNVADGGGYTIDVVANTPGGVLDPGSSNPFDLYQGNYVVDSAPTIGTITATSGDVTVTWTNGAPDATSIDVILYDVDGNVIEDDNVGPTVTSDTFNSVADGQGYTIDVVANTPGGSLDSGSSNAFDLLNGVLSNDAPPTITTVTCSGGTLVVDWTSNASDVTSYDVILLDGAGNTVSDDSLGAAALSDTLASVADGDGYSVEVIAHTPFGDFTATSETFDISGGSIVVTPIHVPTPIVMPSPIVVDPTSVTLTAIDGGAGGWTVSWPELASAPTDGDYVVTDDQGDSCTAQPTGVAGTILSCTLAARADGSTDLTGLTVTFEPVLWFEAAATGSAHVDRSTATSSNTAGTSPAVAISEHVPTATSTHPTPVLGGVTPLAAVTSSDSTPWAIGASGIVLLLAALAMWMRRRRIL